MLTTNELIQEAEWRRCAADEIYFLEKYWYIRHPEHGKILFKLRDAQKEILEVWNTERYSISLKARQIGWSTLAAGHSFWLTFFHANRPVVFLSRTEREAVDLLALGKYGYRGLPEWMRKRGPQLTNDHQLKMPFDNASSIESMPSRQDPARGKSVYLVIVDEWAFLENPEEAWASIEPITDIGGRVIGISTANGWGNFFHEFWVKAETGVSKFKPMFFPWSVVPERDPNFIESKRRSGMLEWQIHQEYPETPEEAFVRSGNPFFDFDVLQALKKELKQPEIGYLNPSTERSSKFVPSLEGELRIWSMPDEMDSYVLGVDTSEGLEHGDFSSIHVIGMRSEDVVAHWHGKIDPDELGVVACYLGYFYGTALAGVEANNHGLTTIVSMRNHRYPNIYYSRQQTVRAPKPTTKFGWSTNKITKPLMMDELNLVLRDGSLNLYCKHTLAELRTYVREGDGSLHGSPFDDRVVSLAIANQMRKYATAPEFVKQKNDYWTYDWFSRMLDKPADDDWVIGQHSSPKRSWAA